MATVKFSKPIKALSIALSGLFLSPAPAAALMPWGSAYLNSGAVGFANHLTEGAFKPESVFIPDQTAVSGKDVPSSLCELVEGMHATDRAHVSQSPAAFPELLEDSGPVSTGLGYDLSPGLRFQGVGVFDMEENYAFLGPAFRLNIEGDLAITTGMQLPIAGDNGQDRLSGLYYAEFMLLF
ncbi:MAG: hypothetical protein A2052_07220 [Deltaproteobacteria bacterium GWA2_54_12]|nr:MAG: hypothetical protein A2052_07220 [Deltaproteobacteria bacterium GWA2_54_12]